MACTTLTVTAPVPTVTLSNIGYGNSAGRFTTCTRPASEIGESLFVYVDYVTTNSPSKINGTFGFTAPSPYGDISYSWEKVNPGASGTLVLDPSMGLVAGSFTNLIANATATA